MGHPNQSLWRTDNLSDAQSREGFDFIEVQDADGDSAVYRRNPTGSVNKATWYLYAGKGQVFDPRPGAWRVWADAPEQDGRRKDIPDANDHQLKSIEVVWAGCAAAVHFASTRGIDGVYRWTTGKGWVPSRAELISASSWTFIKELVFPDAGGVLAKIEAVLDRQDPALATHAARAIIDRLTRKYNV